MPKPPDPGTNPTPFHVIADQLRDLADSLDLQADAFALGNLTIPETAAAAAETEAEETSATTHKK